MLSIYHQRKRCQMTEWTTHVNALERMIFLETALISDRPLNVDAKPRFFEIHRLGRWGVAQKRAFEDKNIPVGGFFVGGGGFAACFSREIRC